MRSDLERRLRKLEQSRSSAFPHKLRAWASRVGGDEEQYGRAVQGHERELDQHLGLDGITWEGFRLLDDLLRRSRGEAPRPAGEFG